MNKNIYIGIGFGLVLGTAAAFSGLNERNDHGSSATRTRAATAIPASSSRTETAPAIAAVAPAANAQIQSEEPAGIVGLGKIHATTGENAALSFEVGPDLLAFADTDSALIPVLRIDTTGNGEIDTRIRGSLEGNQAVIDAPDLGDLPLAEALWQIGMLHDGRYVAAVSSEDAQIEGVLPDGEFSALVAELDTTGDIGPKSEFSTAPQPEKPGIARRMVTAPVRAVKAAGRGLRRLLPF
ncbi:MAG: hypothetical protein GY725_12460 [bacterium]|nr:hypothetical protein [bacterium]